jgi:hypothetical protein
MTDGRLLAYRWLGEGPARYGSKTELHSVTEAALVEIVGKHNAQYIPRPRGNFMPRLDGLAYGGDCIAYRR